MTNILVINPPSKDKTINRDMAGGLGYSAGEGVVLPPIDLLNAVTTLKKLKHKVIFVDAIAEKIDDIGYFYDLIKKNKIEVVIMGLALPTLSEDSEFALKLRNFKSELKLFFKTGINYKQILEKILVESRVDMILFGECDLIIDEFLSGKRQTACVTWEKGKVKYNPITGEDRIMNLDDLPISARDVLKLDLYKYVLLPGKATTMQTSRGCPYPCGYYCPYPLVQGKVWRNMSNERVVKEIELIVKLGVRNILFRDATFTLDMKRTKEFCELLIAKKIKINWWCETRINVLSEDLLKIMRKAGCKGINVGIETLDQELIVRQGKPGVSLEAVKSIRGFAKKIGMKLHFLMIIGLPDENIRTIINTFNYLTDLNPESVGFSTITPYPGTEMFVEAMRDGLIDNFDWNKFNGSLSNMRTKYLNETDMKLIRLILMSSAFAMKKGKLISWPIITANRLFLNVWKILRRE